MPKMSEPLRRSYLLPDGFPTDFQRLGVLIQVFSDMDGQEEIERALDYLRRRFVDPRAQMLRETK